MERSGDGVVLTKVEAELVLELCSMAFKMSSDLELWQSKHIISTLAAGLVKSLGLGRRKVKALEALARFTKEPESCAKCCIFSP